MAFVALLHLGTTTAIVLLSLGAGIGLRTLGGAGWRAPLRFGAMARWSLAGLAALQVAVTLLLTWCPLGVARPALAVLAGSCALLLLARLFAEVRLRRGAALVEFGKVCAVVLATFVG